MAEGITDTKGNPGLVVTSENEAENAAKLIGKDRKSEPRAVDEPCSLESPLVLIGEHLYTVRILQRDIIGIGQGGSSLSLFVMYYMMIGNGVERSRTYGIVVVEEHEQSSDSGWKQEKRIFGECVRKEEPSAITHTNLVCSDKIALGLVLVLDIAR
ncbi:hypothetical protein F5148DRAFT_1153240 [Russula earlei]|uniref:Uncharacterized protein n=1 Tax=Russula earlei TaxID=71964 RepID=A0ACC0TVG6_9AGAM|nr:hypothetical protein F5148DRAFT_1153240 [Russula earlei]